jgi:predicted nucleotidyltransferase
MDRDKLEIIERRARIRCNLIRKAFEWARGLGSRVTAILIGSYARGDFNLWSDVDIILISEDLVGYPVERLKTSICQPAMR